MNLFHLLAASAARFPDRGAVYRGDACVWRYAALEERSLRLAGALLREGVPGDRVAVAARNHEELLVLMFATWAAGMAFAPLNAKLHPREMAEIVLDAEPRFLFADGALMPALAPLVPEVVRPVEIGSDAYRRMASSDAAAPMDVDADALAWLFYTSGTTGRSKGAMLSHRNLMAMTGAHLADFEDLTEADSLIHAAPMSHGSGLHVLPYVARGARQVVPESGGFDAAEFLRLCDRHPGCGAFMAPTMVQRVRQEAEARGCRPAHLRSITYGGGPMYLDEIRRSLDRFGPIFQQLYGQGEAPMTITGLRRRDFGDRSDRLLGSVGWARTGVAVRVVDAEGRPAAAGEIGEILCRGDVVMQGYWRNPEASAAALEKGWLRTGDMGCLDETGLLTLRDRSKDVIISGGTNIYPREVEEVLLAHPAVREASVVGCPDPEWGEVVLACIVAEPGARVVEVELDALCLARIARFKRPKRYRFLEALPKNSYGKVLKRDLKSLVSQEEPA